MEISTCFLFYDQFESILSLCSICSVAQNLIKTSTYQGPCYK